MYNPIAMGYWRPVLVRQPPGVPDVALTFDDGPAPETTPRVLQLLDAAGAKATFFLNGAQVAKYRGLAADIIAAGHAVYGHAWEHQNLERAAPSEALSQMRKVEDVLRSLRPTPSPYLLRLPYNAGYNRNWMHRVMRQFHPDVRFAFHTLSTHDYALAKGCTDRAMLADRCRAVADRICAHPALPGSIILMHEKPLGVDDPLASYIAETLLPLMLAGVAARNLPIGLLRTTAPHRWRDRYLLLHGAVHA